MLVLGMNSKRQRRPNVRLGEIGDVSASQSHGNSQKPKENLEEKRWKHELEYPRETNFNAICGFPMRSSELTVSDPGVSPRVSADTPRNRENRNPNSTKSHFEFASSDETNASKLRLDFGAVTRKGRLMKRRGRSIRSNNGVIGRAWNSRVSPEISNKSGKVYGSDEFAGPTAWAGNDVYTVDGFKDASDRETSDTSKEAHENEWVEPVLDMQVRGDSGEFWMRDDCKEVDALYSDDDHCVGPISSGGADRIGLGYSIVNSVRGWLEELGFGKYAGIFEMHEVDEEVLPQLTFEDLKEMGIYAVGPRRRLYTAIQLLKEGGVSV